MLLLALAGLAAAAPVLSPREAAPAARCTDFLHQQCNSVANKIPPVSPALPTGESVEIGLSATQKEDFEHLVGHGFRASPVVEWVTAEFTKRAVPVVVEGCAPGCANSTEVVRSSPVLLAVYASLRDARPAGSAAAPLVAPRCSF